MEWDLVQRVGTQFQLDGRTFYDLAVGPSTRRAVVCGVGVLNDRYGFIWYYTLVDGKAPFTREDAAKTLISQHRFSLMDYRWFLLTQGKLSNKGEEIGFKPGNKILDNEANRTCSDREYESVA